MIKVEKCDQSVKCDKSGNGWERRAGRAGFSEAGAGRELPQAEAGQGESNLEILNGVQGQSKLIELEKSQYP